MIAWLEQSGIVRDGVVTTTEGNPPGERHTFRLGLAGQAGIAIVNDSEPISNSDLFSDLGRIVVVGPLVREWFLANAYTEDPTCPRCGDKADWNAIANEWFEAREADAPFDAVLATCSACGASIAPWAFEWAGSAAFARWYIEVWHVHQGEAKPTAEMLDGLAKATGTRWGFIYCQF